MCGISAEASFSYVMLRTVEKRGITFLDWCCFLCWPAYWKGVVRLMNKSLLASSVMQVTSLASHTLHRERKGLATLQLPSCCRGTQLAIDHCGLVIRCSHPLNTWCNCTPWQQMRSKNSTDLIGHIKFLPWRQLDGCSMTWPFSLCEGCGLQD